MSRQPVAYMLFGAGAVIALIMEMLGVPALIFALGMYLPLELNTPALVGGFLAHWLGKRADARGRAARRGHSRARRHHRRGPDGGRRAGRRLRRGAAPAAVVFGSGRAHAVLRQRAGVANRLRRRCSSALCVYVWCGRSDDARRRRHERTVRRPGGQRHLGIDTLWGGDVMCPSGTGRFIADSWFSDEPLPPAYTHPAAARVRETAASRRKAPDRAAIDALPRARGRAGRDPRGLERTPRHRRGLRGVLRAAWRIASRSCGTRHGDARRGEPVPYERCVRASTGAGPEPSDPRAQARARRANCSRAPGTPRAPPASCSPRWTPGARERLVPMASVRALGAAFIAHFDRLSERHLLPYLPAELRGVPRANIEFLPIKDAWFSGSMNYLGRARGARRHARVRGHATRSTPRCRSPCPSSSSWSATRWCPATSRRSPICRTSTCAARWASRPRC